MRDPYKQEKRYVETLMTRLGITVTVYDDPRRIFGRETGADVMVLTEAGKRIGVQLTTLDTGTRRGQSRGCETRMVRDARDRGLESPGMFVQNSQNLLMTRLKDVFGEKVKISLRHDFKEFNASWLLVVSGIPEEGAVGSTFLVTTWLTSSVLDSLTLTDLERSNYDRAFLCPIHGLEEAFYSWEKGGGWQKTEFPSSRNPKYTCADELRGVDWIIPILSDGCLGISEILDRVDKAADEEAKKVISERRALQC